MSANNESTGSNVAEFCDFFVSPPEILRSYVGESISSVSRNGKKKVVYYPDFTSKKLPTSPSLENRNYSIEYVESNYRPGYPLDPMYSNHEEVSEQDMIENPQPGYLLDPMYSNHEEVSEQDMIENPQPGYLLDPMYSNHEEVSEQDMIENPQPGYPLDPMYSNHEEVSEQDMIENPQPGYLLDPMYSNHEEVSEQDMIENPQRGYLLDPMYSNHEEVSEQDMIENPQPGYLLDPMYSNHEKVSEQDMIENPQRGYLLDPMYSNHEEVSEQDMIENPQPGYLLDPMYSNHEEVSEQDMIENPQPGYPLDPMYSNHEEVSEQDMIENPQVLPEEISLYDEGQNHYHAHCFPQPNLYDEGLNHYPAHCFPQPNSDGKLKPPFGYVGLCVLVLSTVEEASVAEMYAIVMDFFPYFETANVVWKHSLRHELSKHAKHGEHEEIIFFKTSEKNGRWKFVPARSSVERKLEKILKSKKAEIMNSMRDTHQWKHVFNCFLTRCKSSF